MWRDTIFKTLGNLITRRKGSVLAVGIIITVLMIVASGRIRMRTQIADMMPEGIPQIVAYQDIVDEYQSATSVMIVIESEKHDKRAMIACAKEMEQKLRSIKKYIPVEDQKLSIGQRLALLKGVYPVAGVQYDTLELVKRVDLKLDTDFAANHGMMVQKTADLENFLNMFGSLALPELVCNINDNMEKEFIDDADNLATIDGEAEAVQGLEGMFAFMQSIDSYIETGDADVAAAAVTKFVTGPEYMFSPDNSLLMLTLQPTVDMNDFEDALTLGYAIYDTLEVMKAQHTDLWIGGSGWMLIQIDEMIASKKDFGWPSVVALGLILLLLIGSFKAWKNPLFSVVCLVIAIIWTTGMLALTLKYLNMMSAAFGLILVGLGIDFGIHVISGFRDARDQGMAPIDALKDMFNRVGAGVVTGAITTAVVFFSLVVTRFEAFSEMGFAIGSGLIITLLVMLIVLPAWIAWDTRKHARTTAGRVSKLSWFWQLAPFRAIAYIMQFRFLRILGGFMKHPVVAALTVVVSVVLAGISLYAARTIEFEYNMLELEPVGIPSVVAQEKILDRFEMSPDIALLKATDLDDCRTKVRQLKKIGNRTGLIGGIDAVTEFIPREKDCTVNQKLITNFAQALQRMPATPRISEQGKAVLVTQLRRLHNNFVEIGELSVSSSGEGNKIIRKCDQIVGKKDSESALLALADKIEALKKGDTSLYGFQQVMGPLLKERLQKMANTVPVTLQTLPSIIRNRYVNAHNDDLLITVYPKANIWDEVNLRRFQEQTKKVSPRVTGTPAINLVFIDMMGEKGKIALMVAFMAILIILLLDFHSLWFTLLALVPLAIGASWMVGLMALLGIKFNIANFVALPLILGIGIDDGVHILHRYRIEGRFSIPTVIRYTGRAILLTSLTTMIAFGSMGLASHRGTASMGQVLFLGVGACFVSSAITLTALIVLLERWFPSFNKKREKKS